MSRVSLRPGDDDGEDGPSYRVPALEKGLDILEHLAAQGVPMTQAALARGLGRGPSELFRMLACLEQRGYLHRDAVSGTYGLTLRLYELSRAHSPFERLLQAAARPMRELADALRESCHLSVLHRGQLVVLAQEENMAPLRLSVEVGAAFPPIHTVSGRLLLAHATPEVRDELLAHDTQWARLGKAAQREFHERLVVIRERGYETASGESVAGITDLAVLIGTLDSTVKAALAVSTLSRETEHFIDTALPEARRYAERVSRLAGIIA